MDGCALEIDIYMRGDVSLTGIRSLQQLYTCWQCPFNPLCAGGRTVGKTFGTMLDAELTGALLTNTIDTV